MNRVFSEPLLSAISTAREIHLNFKISDNENFADIAIVLFRAIFPVKFKEGIFMTAVAEKVMESALDLSPVDRAELIERLFLSFDPNTVRPVDEAWKKEIDSRMEAFGAGKIQASPADEVFERIAKR